MIIHEQAVERNERVARVLDGLAAAIRDDECPVQFSPLLMEARKLLSGELAPVSQPLMGVQRPEDVARALEQCAQMVERRIPMHEKMEAQYDQQRIWDAADRCKSRAREATEIAEAIRTLSGIPHTGQPQEGRRLVPVEPTLSMTSAALGFKPPDPGWHATTPSHVVRAYATEIYKAMLSAAPASPRETDAECERRLLDEEAADNLRLIDWIADKIGLPKNEELSRENFAQWLSARARASPRAEGELVFNGCHLDKAVAEKQTPAARWREEGKPDPHRDRYDCERARLIGGKFTDDEVANAVFLDPGIENLTIAKDRIRWLSRRLASVAPALKTAILHLEHMAAWIGKQNAGYSFEGLGEDMPGIRDAFRRASSEPGPAKPAA